MVRFLARCQADGMKVENCPAYVHEWKYRGIRKFRWMTRIQQQGSEGSMKSPTVPPPGKGTTVGVNG